LLTLSSVLAVFASAIIIQNMNKIFTDASMTFRQRMETIKYRPTYFFEKQKEG
jgi:hypothetical protein